MPLIWDKSRSPPWPIFSDSKATYHRHAIVIPSALLLIEATEEQVHLAMHFLEGMFGRFQTIVALALMYIHFSHCALHLLFGIGCTIVLSEIQTLLKNAGLFLHDFLERFDLKIEFDI